MKWYERSRRRYFLDFHIDDWNPEFLSRFDPEEYARLCEESGATAATFMANTHSGLVNWPSKLGAPMHRAFVGRDMLRETIDALHARGLDAVVYYVFVFVVDYWDKHPEARTVREDGRVVKQRVGTKNGEARFATCCINDPGYRARSLGELREICENYDFEGIWPDMTFWPTVCYCENCRRRYRAETGREMPRIIDWNDKEFVSFTRVRERWLREFCQEVTDVIRTAKPGMKFAQQSQTLTWDWVSGTSVELADCWDWMSADMYCDRYGLSFSSKLFYALSNMKPFERVNCWNYPNIHEHVVTRTKEELSQIAYNTIMHDGALVVIDQIDPSGKLHTRNYETMKDVFDRIRRYEPYLGGRMVQDVGIYYSYASLHDPAHNGRPVREEGCVFEWKSASMMTFCPETHMKSVAQAAKTLTMFHVPYGIVTKKNLNELSRYRVLILCNVTMMDEEEAEAIRKFVENGGCVYASKQTGIQTPDGAQTAGGLLADLLGARITGTTKEDFTYVSPTPEGQEEFAEDFSADYPVTIADEQTIVETDADTTILGTLTLPYHCPSEERYAALLTTPPGDETGKPAVVEHRYGKGRTIYSTAMLEIGEHITQRRVFYRMIRRLSPEYSTHIDGYPSLEATRFEYDGGCRVHVLNYQAELPNIPIFDLKLRVRMDGKQARAVRLLPEGTPLEYAQETETACITLPRIDDYALIEIEYANEAEK